MTFSDIKSLYDLPSSGNTYNEQQYVPLASAYEIVLQRTPQVSSNLNLWVDVSTAAAHVQAWKWVSTAWVSLTLVGTAPANNTSFALQCRDTHYVNSPRLEVHSSLAGFLIKVQYNCYESAMDSKWFTEIQEHIARLESFIHLAPFSAKSYSGGKYNDTIPDDLTVYLSPSRFLLDIPPVKSSYAGATLDFSTGSIQITFTIADGYRNVGVYLIPQYNAGSHSLVVATSQGTEQVSSVDVPEPTALAGLHLFTIKANVISSVVQPIEQADITQYLHLRTTPGRFVLSFSYDGTLISGEDLDCVNGPGINCVLVGISIVGEVLGSSGSTVINIKQYDTGNPTGTDIFAVDGDKPTLAYNDSVNVPKASDISDVTQSMILVTPTQSFKPIIQSVASGTVQHVTVNMFFETL